MLEQAEEQSASHAALDDNRSHATGPLEHRFIAGTSALRPLGMLPPLFSW